MYLIALSENVHINPGGDVDEGFAKYVNDEPILNSSTI